MEKQSYKHIDRSASYAHLLPRHIELGELKTANHLLDDRAALDAAWRRDGYWFSRGVIDLEAVSEIRRHLMSYLEAQGLVDPGIGENRYNGSRLDKAGSTPEDLFRLLHFNRIHLGERFTQNPSVARFITHVLGDEPFWLPQTDFRAVAPLGDPDLPRLSFPHQDGFFTPGVDMKTCWVPVDAIDPDLGGCAWLEGAHNGPPLNSFDEPPPHYFGEVPTRGWKTARFEAGDIVIFHRHIPHGGLSNISRDRFRLSFDMRVTGKSGNTAIVGDIVRLSPTRITVRNRDSGKEQTLAITDNTFVKDASVVRMTGAEIPAGFAIGETVLVTSEDGRTAAALSPEH